VDLGTDLDLDSTLGPDFSMGPFRADAADVTTSTRPFSTDCGRLAALVGQARAWAAGRNPWIRIPLLAFFAYVGVRQVANAEFTSVFGAINLGIHEAGHFVFAALGPFLHAAGGTILQLLAPLVALVLFVRQPDWFGAAVCLGWLSTNLHHVGTYMADADEMRLPLVTVGPADAVTHDWRFLFERMDLLHRCETVGAATHGLAHLAMAACLASGAWLLWSMRRSARR
jgi:hypothetical protein